MECLLNKGIQTQMEVREVVRCIPVDLYALHPPHSCHNFLLRTISPFFFKHVVCAKHVVFFRSYISWSQIIGVAVVIYIKLSVSVSLCYLTNYTQT